MSEGQKTYKPCRWQWLYNHPRKGDIIRYVDGDDVDLSGIDPLVIADITKHRRIVELSKIGIGLRPISDEVGLSHESVRAVINKYRKDGGNPGRDEPSGRLLLKRYALQEITPEVYRRYQNGKLTTTDVAGLIGHGCSASHARYWLSRYPKLNHPKPKQRRRARKASASKESQWHK